MTGPPKKKVLRKRVPAQGGLAALIYKIVCELLKPYDARQMRSYPVSSRINYVANDDEECSRPVEIAEEQRRLFAG